MKYILLLLALCCAEGLRGQVNDSPSQDDYYEETDENATSNLVSPGELIKRNHRDTDPIDLKRFDKSKWKEVVGTVNFEEENALAKRKKNVIDTTHSSSANGKERVIEDNRNELYEDDEEDIESDESNYSFAQGPVATIVVYALGIGIIGYILFLILQNISLRNNTKVTVARAVDVSETVADIRELEIDKLLREATTAGNFKLAIRIYFLGLLKKLDEDGFIAWKKDKTNRDYLNELFPKVPYFREIKSLTLAYEQVWYGDHTLSQQAYDEIISSFKAIHHRLNAPKASGKES